MLDAIGFDAHLEGTEVVLTGVDVTSWGHDLPGKPTLGALVRAILEAQPREVVIEGMTDQRMLERHGDLATPEARDRAANEALVNEASARVVAAELDALEQANDVRADAGVDLKLFVESAYSPEPAQALAIAHRDLVDVVASLAPISPPPVVLMRDLVARTPQARVSSLQPGWASPRGSRASARSICAATR